MKNKRGWIFSEFESVIRSLEGIAEVLILVTAFCFLFHFAYSDIFTAYSGLGRQMLIYEYAFLIVVLFRACESFAYGEKKATDIMTAQAVSMTIINVVLYVQLCAMVDEVLHVYPMLILLLLDFIVLFICVYVFTVIYHSCNVPHRMLMVYGDPNTLTLKFKMDSRADRYKIEKIISEQQEISEILRTINGFDAVVLSGISQNLRAQILKYCYERRIRVYIVPDISDVIVRGADDVKLFDTPLLQVNGHGLTLAQRIVKRIVDLVLCLIAMIPGSIIMLIVALAIKLEDHGPIFYRQKRVTRNGKEFEILKFRSMIVDAEKEGKSIPAIGNDPRITKVGHIIRPIRIDELPQLLNIIKGDMSIVGPRPERVEHVRKYIEEIPEFAFRFKVKGGLTGYAQIYGKYNTSAYDKLKMDMHYIENYSLIEDFRLILMTIPTMFRKESTEGFDTVEDLDKEKEQLLRKLG